MSGPHEVIMYRNPLEYAMWNSLSESGVLFPIMVSAVVFIASVVVVSKILNRILPWNKQKVWWVSLLLWGIPSILTILAFNHFYI